MELFFGEVLKSIRKQRKMTQKMLCEDICSQSVLSRIESGVELPNVLVMQQLCERLEVSIDQVMHDSSSTIQHNQKIFASFADLFQHKRYKELDEKLKAGKILETLYLEKDFQMYYYYLGSCEYYLNHNLEKSLTILKQGLQYTSKITYLSATEEVVQLISCAGRIYAELGKLEEADYYLKRSIQLFDEIPKERVHIGMIKVFFNYAFYLFKIGHLEEAEPVVDQGIRLAHQKCSYYFLDELYRLKSAVCREVHDHQQADIYQELAEKVAQISEEVRIF